MSRKHFEAIAAAIKNNIEKISYDSHPERQLAHSVAVNIAHDFADIAANNNPRFDTERFLAACGIKN